MERSLHAEHTYAQFLDELLTSEQHERGRKGEKMRTKPTRLPYRKSLKEFDFSFQSSIDKWQIDGFATLAFAARAENIILLEPPSVGKTHLAVDVSVAICANCLSPKSGFAFRGSFRITAFPSSEMI